jgi:DNA-binding MarR family transcriptional regulator
MDMEKMDIIDKQKYIFGSIFLIANKLQVLGDQYFADDDMTTKQWLMTVMISQFHDESPTLTEVAELIGSSHQNAKQIAVKLEKKGFLIIEKDDRDGRAIRLRLTEKCNSFWEKRTEKDDHYIVELFKDLSQEETKVMCRGMEKLYDKIERMKEKE